MVELTINETLQTGAVGNRTYQGRKSTGDESVYLFSEFTINARLNFGSHDLSIIYTSRFPLPALTGAKLFPNLSSILCFQVLLCKLHELFVVNNFYISVVLLNQIDEEMGTGRML